jgi:hypothetical protein
LEIIQRDEISKRLGAVIPLFKKKFPKDGRLVQVVVEKTVV